MKNSKVENIAIIGLGYVGLPLASEFSEKFCVLGFDNDQIRVEELKMNYDRTNEISERELASKKNNLRFTSSEKELKDINIFIVTVPTPVDKNNNPDLSPIIGASTIIGRYLKKEI